MEPAELIEWRQRNGCSQGILSRILGVDIMTISRWERDIQKVPPFLGLALRHVETTGDMVSGAIENRKSERRSHASQRLADRRRAEIPVPSDKRASERRSAPRRKNDRRSGRQ